MIDAQLLQSKNMRFERNSIFSSIFFIISLQRDIFQCIERLGLDLLFYPIYLQSLLSKQMATQRIKTPQMIEAPYLRTSNDITQLQIKDSRLQSSILNLRDKIQSKCKDRECKNCKIFEEQISLLKKQQKDKVSQLQQVVSSLEEEKRNLSSQIIELRNKQQQMLKDEQVIKLSALQEERRLTTKFFNKEAIGKSHHHSLSDDPELYFQITTIQEKSSYFEERSKALEKQLNEKNKMKEEDSLRIINLLDEVENHKRQLHNMDRYYQNLCAQLEQEKERVIYELTSKIRDSQNQTSNLKIFIETLNHQKDNLWHQVQVKNSQILNLKHQNGQLKVDLSESTRQLHSLSQEHSSKVSQYVTLVQSVNKLQQQNLSLSYRLAQETQINLENTKRYVTLQQEMASLKKSHFSLSSKMIEQNSKEKDQEIAYLTKILQQDKLIIESKDNQIEQLKHQLTNLSSQNKELSQCIQDQFVTIERAERNTSIQNSAIKTLEAIKQELKSMLESSTAQKRDLEDLLNKQTELKKQYSKKYLEEAEKYRQLNKKYYSLERQMNDYDKLKNLTTQIQLERQQVMRLNMEKSNLLNALATTNSKVTAKEQQNLTFSHNFQIQASLIEAKQKEIQLKQNEIQHIAELNHQIYNEMNHYKSQNTQLLHKIRQLEPIVFQLEQRNNILLTQIEESKTQKQVLQQVIQKLQQEQANLTKSTLSQKQQFLHKITNLENENIRIKMDIIEKEKIIEIQKLSKITYKDHKKQLQKSIEQLFTQNIRLKDRIQVLLDEIKQANTKQAEIKKLEAKKFGSSQQDQNEKEFLKLHAEYNQLLRKNEALAQSQRIATQNIIYLKQKIESMNKVYESNSDNKTHQQLLKELNNKKQTITQLLTNFKYLEKTLKKTESDFQFLKEENKKYCKQAERQKLEMSEKISLKQKEIATLRRQKDEESRQSLAKFKEMQKQAHNLHDQFKQKQKNLQDEKRQLEKELAKLSEQKRKFQQSSAREIINLKESLQTQKKKSRESSLNSSPVKVDDTKRKEIETLKKTIAENATKISQLQNEIIQKQNQVNKLKQLKTKDQEKIHQACELLSEAQVHLDIKQRQSQQANIKNKELNDQLRDIKLDLSKKNIEIDKLRQQLVLKEKQHTSLQESIRSIEGKYIQLKKQITEKNVAYDFLWMQLDESKTIIKRLEKQLKEKNQFSNDSNQIDQQITVSQAIQPLNTEETKTDLQALNLNEAIYAFGANIRKVQSFTEPQGKEYNQEVNINLTQDPAKVENKVQKDIIMPKSLQNDVKELKKKHNAKHLLLHHALSEVVSDSEQNDEINEMISNRDSDHRSHLQSPMEAFSEYSRIKSTRSELNHKQIQNQYKNKIKNSKMMAKLGKLARKK